MLFPVLYAAYGFDAMDNVHACVPACKDLKRQNIQWLF